MSLLPIWWLVEPVAPCDNPRPELKPNPGVGASRQYAIYGDPVQTSQDTEVLDKSAQIHQEHNTHNINTVLTRWRKMDKTYYDFTTKMEEAGVDDEYVQGWQMGYIDMPDRE